MRVLFALSAVLVLSACTVEKHPPAPAGRPATIDSVAASAMPPSATPQIKAVRALYAGWQNGLYRSATLVAYTAPDSTVKLRTQVYVSNWHPGDSLLYSYYRGAASASVTGLKSSAPIATQRSVALLDSVFAVAPAYGDSASFLGCAQIRYGSNGSLSALSCWVGKWKYLRSAPPAAAIDSLKRVDLRGEPLVPGGPYTSVAGRDTGDSSLVQFCVFGVFKSGARVKLANSQHVPRCEQLYQRWLGEALG